MLEPTVIRQTGTLTDWDGTNGTALADNGEIHRLTLADIQPDPVGRPIGQGARVELYLYRNEYGRTESVECRIMPVFDRQGGYRRHCLYEQTAGRRFYADPHIRQRRHAVNIVCCFAMLLLLWAWGSYRGNQAEFGFAMSLTVLAAVGQVYAWRENRRRPQGEGAWLFTLNREGMAFCLPERGGRYGWCNWTDVAEISFKTSRIFRRPYLFIECRRAAQTDRYKIPLAALSGSERQAARTYIESRIQAT